MTVVARITLRNESIHTAVCVSMCVSVFVCGKSINNLTHCKSHKSRHKPQPQDISPTTSNMQRVSECVCVFICVALLRISSHVCIY